MKNENYRRNYGIEYKIRLIPELKTINITDFDVIKFLLHVFLTRKNFRSFKWISPKRTRSYPYEKVYNTFLSEKITIILIIKGEGSEGDRDFIQWDTISLMSLLDVCDLYIPQECTKHGTRKIKLQISSSIISLLLIK